VFGAASALLTGDALLALAFRVIAALPGQAGQSGVANLADTVARMCAGQYADVAFEHRTEVSLPETIEMAGGKTGALLACACKMGAIAAFADSATVAAFEAFGESLGLALQYIDDVLGIWGDPVETGKPAGGDLLARKKTLPIVAALTSGSPYARRLREAYVEAPEISARDIPVIVSLLEAAGAREWAESEADRLCAHALSQLDQIELEPAARSDLELLAEFVSRRDR
jgi:geranylgeranyl diphosphate synthase, type I